MHSAAGEPSIVDVATPNTDWVGRVSSTGYILAAKLLKQEVKTFRGRKDNQPAFFRERLG